MKLAFVALLFTVSCCLTEVSRHHDNPCIKKETCGECMTAHPDCAWCLNEDFVSDRCDLLSNIAPKCESGSLVHTISQMEKLKDLEHDREAGEVVHVRPQEISLKLRQDLGNGMPVFVKLDVTENYPVDIYYLADLSASMREHKSKLEDLSKALSDEIVKVTSNVRLGFGSFIGKAPKRQQKQCVGCDIPYTFHNHLDLSSNVRGFLRTVQEARVSNTSDIIPTGFEAMMQAVVCKRDIRWREKSKKILVFASGSASLNATAGQISAFVTPTDGLCHLGNDGYYIEDSEQREILLCNQIIQDNDISLIFSVTADQVPAYERLSELMGGQSVVNLDDHSEVGRTIKAQYDNITLSIELEDNATSPVQVTYLSRCLDATGFVTRTNKCENLKTGSTVYFRAEIQVNSRPENSVLDRTFVIYPVGNNEGLTVNLRVEYMCDCEKPWNREENSFKCSNAGLYQCGACSCDNNRFGKYCECSALDVEVLDERSCYNGNDTLACSGRGHCVCGICECAERPNREEQITGKFCECDNFSCHRHNGALCGGREKGICDCGICLCKPGWIGSDCTCANSVETCISPMDGRICSGHGDCRCGVCNCYQKDNILYYGRFCETYIDL